MNVTTAVANMFLKREIYGVVFLQALYSGMVGICIQRLAIFENFILDCLEIIQPVEDIVHGKSNWKNLKGVLIYT